MFKDYIESTLEFVPSRVDSDMYFRRDRKPDDTKYYELSSETDSSPALVSLRRLVIFCYREQSNVTRYRSTSHE